MPKSKEEIQSFYDVNYQGTVNLCKGLEYIGCPKAFVFISTVAVYGDDYDNTITETHPLNGTTPYAKSKIQAETFLTEWCRKNNVILTILRPSLLAGEDAPGNLGAMVRGIRKGFYVNIAGGKVRKCILMAKDIANIIPLVATKGGIYNVCDSNPPSFGQLAKSIAEQLNKRQPISIPYWFVWCIAKVGDLLGKKAPINSYKLFKMMHALKISNQKARNELGWEPLNILENYKV